MKTNIIIILRKSTSSVEISQTYKYYKSKEHEFKKIILQRELQKSEKDTED